MAMPAMAPGLSVALDPFVDELAAVDAGSVLAEDVGGDVSETVEGMKGVGVAVDEPCEEAAIPLAVRLT